MAETFSFVGPNGWKLYAHYWPAPNASKTLLGVHGYSEHGACYDHFADYLNRNNFSVLFLDLPGHGKSEGRRNNIDDFEDYLESIELFNLQAQRRNLPYPFYLFGHSLGGLITTRFIQESSSASDFVSLTLSAPFLGIYNFGRLKNWVVEPLVQVMPNLTIPNQSNLGLNVLTCDLEMQKRRENDPLINPMVTTNWLRETYQAQRRLFKKISQISLPVGVFQGEDELVVDKEKVQSFYNELAVEKHFKSYPGFRHEILNEIGRATVMKDMLDWLTSLPRSTVLHESSA